VNIAIANRFLGLLCIESYIQHEKIDDGWFFFFTETSVVVVAATEDGEDMVVAAETGIMHFQICD
jgi:hypothetical protein